VSDFVFREETNAMIRSAPAFLLFIVGSYLHFTESSAQDSHIVLSQVQEAICDVGFLDQPNDPQGRNCSMLTGFQSVPNIHVALFRESGGQLSPCCGDLVITFRAQLFKDGAEVSLTGRRSVDSELGAQAEVTFR
jgi:hypothetical protein